MTSSPQSWPKAAVGRLSKFFCLTQFPPASLQLFKLIVCSIQIIMESFFNIAQTLRFYFVSGGTFFFKNFSHCYMLREFLPSFVWVPHLRAHLLNFGFSLYFVICVCVCCVCVCSVCVCVFCLTVVIWSLFPFFFPFFFDTCPEVLCYRKVNFYANSLYSFIQQIYTRPLPCG